MSASPSSPCPPAVTAAPEGAEAAAPGLLDLVTVVYGGEVAQLRLQARSIARFLDPEGIGRILILLNDRDAVGLRRRLEALRASYGPFASRVELIDAGTVFARRPPGFTPRGLRDRLEHALTHHRQMLPVGLKSGWRGNRGWSVQQALKLAVARVASGTHLLLLDAKNHFIRPVSRASFVAPDGRAKTYLTRPSDKHFLWIDGAFRLMGLSVPDREAPAPPTVTPFVIARGTLLACLTAIEARLGPVETFFARRHVEKSEFTLIHAAVIAATGRWETAFAPGLLPAATLHRNDDAARIGQTLTRAEAGTADILSVHTSRLGRLSAEEVGRLTAIWAAAGLEPDGLLGAATAQPA